MRVALLVVACCGSNAIVNAVPSFAARASILAWWLTMLGSGAAHAETVVAFVDVNVVPMHEQRVLSHQTVLVRDGTISQIGPAGDITVESEAQRIEGKGTAYLVPALSDMHVHVSEPDDLALYLVNGVTTILHMGGDPVVAAGTVSRELESSSIASPRVFFAFKIHGGGQGLSVTTPEEARSAVDLAKANGYHFIKVYNELSEPVFAAIVEQARRHGIAIVGHAVRAVGLPKALFEGQVMVAHAEEFYYSAFDSRAARGRIPQVVAETQRSRAYVTPTLAMYAAILDQWGRPARIRQYLKDARARFMTPNVRADWVNGWYASASQPADKEARDVLTFQNELTKALHDAGVPLLAGTDSPQVPGMYPGYSIHDELRALVEAGLTPYDALSAATRTAGEFVAKSVPAAQRFGTVVRGLRADLILVNGNPLNSLGTLRQPLGVMKAGRWFTREQLDALLEGRRKKYQIVQ